MKELDVYLDGILCGTLEQSSSGNLTFEYDEAYRATPGATPLSLSMPLAATSHKKRTILPFLQGLLPDNDEALRAMATRFSVSANSPFALLEQVGTDVAGAIQLVAEGAPAPDRTESRGHVRAVSDREIATLLEQTVSGYTEGAPYFTEVGRFSLAGAQPKIALHEMPGGGWGVPELIRSLPFEADRASVGEGFYRAFVFNVIAGCTDAHAKNYSLLLDGPSVALAPLYDLVSYAAYWDGQARLSSAMSVGGEYGLEDIGSEALVAAGRQFGIGSDAREIVEGTRAGVLGAFESATEELEDLGSEVRGVADDLIRGLRQLPLLVR